MWTNSLIQQNTVLKRLGAMIRGTANSTDQPQQESEQTPTQPSQAALRLNRICTLISENVVDLEGLRKLVWSGAPPEIRWKAWALCLGYLPPNSSRHEEVLARKRAEYRSIISSLDMNGNSTVLKQIRLDIPRTYPALPHIHEAEQKMERVLFAWSLRNPASSYVQGINDILVPIINVLACRSGDQDEIEADAYFLLTKLLADIQDHYIFGQPGIQKMAAKLAEIIEKSDPELSRHFSSEQLDILHVSFRWLNCLLVRELQTEVLLRVWDACIADGNGFSVLIVYVCAVLMHRWRKELMLLDFQGMMLFFQKCPEIKDAETVLAEAFVLKSLFEGSAHLSM